MKRVLITGSNGLLGQTLIRKFQETGNAEVYGLAKGANRLKNKAGYTYIDLDLLEFDKVAALIQQIAPDVIIHTAAMTHVDLCEKEQEACELINVKAVGNLVSCCRKYGIHLIHISTDFIFDGLKGYYTEEDLPCPVNYYGLSKLRSEELIRESGIEATVLRTILVYGLTEDMKSNIILWVKNNLENKRDIKVVTDQWRMPTHVDDLADACIYACEKGVKGVFNVSSNQLLSIYEIALLVAEVFDLDKKYIHPVLSSELNLPAKRPVKTGFDLSRSISQLNLEPHSFESRLQRFKDQLLNKK